MFTDFRLRIIHFFKKYGKIIVIALLVWVVVFLINTLLKSYKAPEVLQTTYEPHTAIMDSSSKVPTTVSNSIENMIAEYVGYCNNAEWPSAYNMLSDTCKEYGFGNSIEEFMKYVYTKMPTPKDYVIQDYSNQGNTYIYQIKYVDDMLATGLTNATYQYTEEKMIFKKQKDGSIEMSVGNFIDYEDVKNISENEYLKIDVRSVIKFYSKETYIVRLTNRSEYTIVLSDAQENNEICLLLNSGDRRTRIDVSSDVVLKPNESTSIVLEFPKYYDNNDDAKSIEFNAIRVMEQYSGTDVSEDVIQSEIQNAISKFSVNIPVK